MATIGNYWQLLATLLLITEKDNTCPVYWITIQMRLMLNLTDPIDLDELNEDLIQKRLAELEKNENWLRSIVKIGVHEYPSKQPLPTKPDELNSTLETRGVMVRKGLWAQITKDGALYFVINEHNQENFKKALNRLSLQIVA